jgi:hypothetical protein
VRAISILINDDPYNSYRYKKSSFTQPAPSASLRNNKLSTIPFIRIARKYRFTHRCMQPAMYRLQQAANDKRQMINGLSLSLACEFASSSDQIESFYPGSIKSLRNALPLRPKKPYLAATPPFFCRWFGLLLRSGELATKDCGVYLFASDGALLLRWRAASR